MDQRDVDSAHACRAVKAHFVVHLCRFPVSSKIVGLGAVASPAWRDGGARPARGRAPYRSVIRPGRGFAKPCRAVTARGRCRRNNLHLAGPAPWPAPPPGGPSFQLLLPNRGNSARRPLRRRIAVDCPRSAILSVDRKNPNPPVPSPRTAHLGLGRLHLARPARAQRWADLCVRPRRRRVPDATDRSWSQGLVTNEIIFPASIPTSAAPRPGWDLFDPFAIATRLAPGFAPRSAMRAATRAAAPFPTLSTGFDPTPWLAARPRQADGSQPQNQPPTPTQHSMED